MVASAAMTASLTTSVVSSNCCGERNCASCMFGARSTPDLLDLSGPGKLRANGLHSPSYYRFRDHAQVPVQEAGHHQLSRTENADVPEVSRETGADAGRERPRKMRGVRAVRGG